MIGFLLTVMFVFHQVYAEQIFSKRNWDKDLTANDRALRKDLVDKHFEPDPNQADIFAQNDSLFKSTVGTQNYSLDGVGPYEMKSYPNCNEDLPIFDLRYIMNNTKTNHDILFVKFDPITYNVIEINSMQVDGRWQAPLKQLPVSYSVTKWNTVNILGEFTNSKPPKPTQLFNFLYAIVNGTLENITSSQEGSIVAKVTSKSGIFGIKIPRNYPTSDLVNGIGDIMVFDKNGGQVITHTTAKDCFYETWVSFSGDAQLQVLFRLSYLIQGAAFHGDKVPSYCLDQTILGFHNDTLVNPLPQFRTGTDFDEISCKQGYALVTKLEDGNPACVQPGTLSKLVSRGWAILVGSTTVSDVTVNGTTYHIPYVLRGHGNKMLEMDANVTMGYLVMHVDSTADKGEITVIIPKALFDPQNQDFVVLVDGVEVKHTEVVTQTARTLTVPFGFGAKEIEIIVSRIV